METEMAVVTTTTITVANGKGNGNGNGNDNSNIKSNENATHDSRVRTRQRFVTPNITGTAYCWIYENTRNDLKTSAVCRYPVIGYKSTATLGNPQSVSTFVML